MHRTGECTAGAEGLVILQNKNQGLPFGKTRHPVKKIAVVGPNADDLYNQLGDYTPPRAGTTVSRYWTA